MVVWEGKVKIGTGKWEEGKEKMDKDRYGRTCFSLKLVFFIHYM